MHSYPNLLGFIVGEDVVAIIRTDASRPYVKAAIRDTKAYIRQKNYRPIPVGYISSIYSRVGFTEETIFSYFDCGNQSDAVDFLGVNWPTSQNFTSPYFDATSLLSNYSVPVFMASYGWSSDNGLGSGLVPSHRNFAQIQTLFSEAMSSVWSGGLIYQFMGQHGTDGYGK